MPRFATAEDAQLDRPLAWPTFVSPDQVREFVAGLSAKDPIQRQKARRWLVLSGHGAVDALIEVLGDRRPHVRWEAAKALGEIGDPAATPALIDALSDPEPDIRWLAAVGLSKIGPSCLAPLLEAMIRHPRSDEILQGVRHVCRAMLRLKPYVGPVKLVLDAFHSYQPDLSLPHAAYRALGQLRQIG